MRRYYITDSRAAGGIDRVLQFVERAVGEGVDMIQVREKHLPARELLEVARRAVALADGTGVQVLVNTRVDVALAAGADGVHLPEDSIAPARWREIVPEGFLIGASCHTIANLQRAEAEGADFAVFGPVFPSPGKGAPIGVAGLAEGIRSTRLPVYALGGVNGENAVACLHAGAAGVAAISLFQRTCLPI
jgi:thiamine-phosphate pyrophosphorylase